MMYKLRIKISKLIAKGYISYLRKVKGMTIGDECNISWRAELDRANPKGILIGHHSRVMLEALILAHDYSRGGVDNYLKTTKIGHHTVIGGRAIILPGIEIGDHVFVAAGSVVTKSIPSHCMVAGNPARIKRTGIILNDRTQIEDFGTLVKENQSHNP